MSPVRTPPPGQPVFQLRIHPEEVVPAVWRRLLVPGTVRLAKLHDMLQAAMGWTNSHLHSFAIGDALYGMQLDDYPEEEIDEQEVTVLQALQDQRRFVYDYDFGDSWTHAVIGQTQRRRGAHRPPCPPRLGGDRPALRSRHRARAGARDAAGLRILRPRRSRCQQRPRRAGRTSGRSDPDKWAAALSAFAEQARNLAGSPVQVLDYDLDDLRRKAGPRAKVERDFWSAVRPRCHRARRLPARRPDR